MQLEAKKPVNIAGLTATLYDHQVKTLTKGLTSNALFDMSEPGTGKTITQIALYLARCQLAGVYKRVLVLATKSTMQSAWGDDIEKAAPSITYAVATAPAANRIRAFNTGADIVITNHDASTWLADNRSLLTDFDHIIVDESTAYKNPQSNRTKALFSICSHFTYRSALSGLPTPNTILELWAQMFFLDGGERLGRAYWKFRSTVCAPVQVGPNANHVKWQDIEGIETAVSALVDDIATHNILEDCIDMPEHLVRDVRFTLAPKHMAMYNAMEKQAILTLEQGTIDATNKAALQTKLLQMLGGSVYGDEGQAITIATERYNVVLDLIEERPHSLCVFTYRHQRDALVALAEKRGVTYAVIDGDVKLPDRVKIVNEFQAGQYQVVFAHPKTAAHGLTMTRGTATIWPQPVFQHEWFVQFNRRIYRNGQTLRTETIVVTADVPLEQRVYAERIGKEERADNFLEYFE